MRRDYEQGSSGAAEWLALAVQEKPDLLLCAATGQSPTRVYEVFASAAAARGLLRLRVLKLDEWGGLSMINPASCEAHLQRLLIQPLKISEDRFIGFQSDALSPETECQRIGAWLRVNGPVDVCVLGLGVNGHLGFNEPADELTASCHVAQLTEETLAHPMLISAGQRPPYGLTLGMRDILASRSILLLVFGAAKVGQLERLLSGGLSARFPASFLTLHQRVVCFCDEAAAARLPDSWKHE